MSSEDENDAVLVEHEHASVSDRGGGNSDGGAAAADEAKAKGDDEKAEGGKAEETAEKSLLKPQKEEDDKREEEKKKEAAAAAEGAAAVAEAAEAVAEAAEAVAAGAALVEEEKEKTEEEKEAEEARIEQKHPRALQIVSIGTEEDAFAFTFHDKKLRRVLSRVPDSRTKVAVVSVVGAFRTGKSFLLSWFLRYMNRERDAEEPDLVGEDGEKAAEDTKKWFEKFTTLGNDGFEWKAGHERNTTGIWMWSQPFVFKEKNLAVLLVDTQGMFDHETTMKLTSSIFGLSTLLSSYQIYNVDKRVQEDNLQQLALFSEYARMAVNTGDTDDGEDGTKQTSGKPFQHVEFLVRDWEHFEDEDTYEEMEKSMSVYLEDLIAERNADDLQETRDQITGCFEKISCYGFCHPGFAVTKSKYSGDVKKIEPVFLDLMDRYCRKVFGNVQPKIIHGRELNAAALGTYVEHYAKLFESGANFPEASTMLEATAAANNTNALGEALEEYELVMDRLAGAEAMNYLQPDELLEQHRTNVTAAVDLFHKRANFGSKKNIESSKRELLAKIDRDFEKYDKLNQTRNPLYGFEMYVLPITIACGSYIVRIVIDWTCAPWSQICKAGSHGLTQIYAVVFCFLVIVAATKAKEIRDVFMRIKSAFDAMNSPGPSTAVKAKTE